MIFTEQNDFKEEQRRAIERMKEINKRSAFAREQTHKMPPTPPFLKVSGQENNDSFNSPQTAPQDFENTVQNKAEKNYRQAQNGFAFPFNAMPKIPVLNEILKDSDQSLILGILLILMSEKADKILLFALVYILL